MTFSLGNTTGFFEHRLGRSSRAALDSTRLMIALAGLASSLSPTHNAWLPLSSFVFSLMLVWSLVIALLPIISWRYDVQWSGLVMTIDFGIMAAIIIQHQNLMLFVPPYATLLLLAMQSAKLLRLQLLAVLGLASLAAVFGQVVEPLFVESRPNSGEMAGRALFVLLCFLALMAIRMRERYVRTLRLWSDGLLIAGSHSQRIPIEFILAQIENRYPETAILWMEDEDSDSPRLTRWFGESVEEVPLSATQWAKSKQWMLAERGFMFDTNTRQILHRAEIDHPIVSKAVEFQVQLIEALGFAGWGLSFPIRVGEKSSRVFVMGTERPSVPALREGIEVGVSIEAVFERFHFQSAWRERAFIEARMALGRDLHDTVLQTMASLRMQIATMLSRPAMKRPSATRDAILQLQNTVAEEQRTFRETLDEGHRAATEPVDLSAILTNRMIVLSQQWDIDCTFVPTRNALMVNANTAMEVEFIIREVVSNSVQHGRAKSLAVQTSLADGMLFLAITDNEGGRREVRGNGTGGEIKSKSLTRRLTSIGASAYADDIVKGTLLSIRIPLSRH
jgi:two-component system, NarL family, nitrate/nitrite sensor histidine kinase NarX